MEVSVSLDVYKALTAKLSYEGQTYDDVIRRLLNMDSPVEPEPFRPVISGVESLSAALSKAIGDPKSFYSRGLRLPDGTSLRAIYKGVPYIAEIKDGDWVSIDGSVHTSPSSAASAITGNNVNGLRFWEALLPGDEIWRKLDALVQQ